MRSFIFLLVVVLRFIAFESLGFLYFCFMLEMIA